MASFDSSSGASIGIEACGLFFNGVADAVGGRLTARGGILFGGEDNEFGYLLEKILLQVG